MSNWIGRIVVCSMLIVCSIIGWQYYPYFFNPHAPHIEFNGLTQEQHYKQLINCKIICSDAYKLKDFCIWLDDKVLLDHTPVNAQSVEHCLCIDTTQLSKGQHTLKVQAMNNLYKSQRFTNSCTFFVDNTPLEIALLRASSELKIMQGRTIHLLIQVNKRVQSARVYLFNHWFNAIKEEKHSPIYEVFIPVSCDEPVGNADVQIEVIDKVGNKKVIDKKIEIIDGLFKKQQTICVDTAKLQQDAAYKTEREFEAIVQSLTDASDRKKLWQGSFYSPIDIASVSTEYGTIRTTQERGRYMHKAVDIVNKPRSVVWATQDAIVVLRDRFSHSGNTIILDHGCGILSLFFHLDTFAELSIGQSIKRGNPIGTLGQTGYAKGYHLHWEMRIGNQHVDPLQWIDPYF